MLDFFKEIQKEIDRAKEIDKTKMDRAKMDRAKIDRAKMDRAKMDKSNNKIPEMSRQDREELRRIGREVQKKFEDTFEEINPEFGESFKNFNNAVNSGLDIIKKGIDNINNSFEAIHMQTLKEEMLMEDEVPEIGDHLWVWRLGYTHHGLYIGDGKVIHYLKERVKEDTLENFARGSKIRIRPYEDSPAHYSQNEIICRARSRIGENNYDLFSNNCEHFVRWCRCGAFDPKDLI